MPQQLSEMGVNLGHLCEGKQAAYGRSVGKSADMLAILYPKGIKPAQYFDGITAARIFDKLSRLAQGDDPHGESPYVDIAGYALVSLQHHNREVGTARPCGDVSAAQHPSQAPSDSAAQSAPAPTTTSARKGSAKSSTKPSPPVSEPTSATTVSTLSAPIANGPWSSPAAARVKVLASNTDGKCALCDNPIPATANFNAWMGSPVDGSHTRAYTCSESCRFELQRIADAMGA